MQTERICQCNIFNIICLLKSLLCMVVVNIFQWIHSSVLLWRDLKLWTMLDMLMTNVQCFQNISFYLIRLSSLYAFICYSFFLFWLFSFLLSCLSLNLFIIVSFQPANILLDESGHVRISDLGLACDFSKKKPHASV